MLLSPEAGLHSSAVAAGWRGSLGGCSVSFVAVLVLMLSVAANLVAQGASLRPADAFLVVLQLIVYFFCNHSIKQEGFLKTTNLKRPLNVVQSSPV